MKNIYLHIFCLKCFKKTLLGACVNCLQKYRAVEVYLIEVYPIVVYLIGKGAVEVQRIPRISYQDFLSRPLHINCSNQSEGRSSLIFLKNKIFSSGKNHSLTGKFRGGDMAMIHDSINSGSLKIPSDMKRYGI